MLSFEQGAVLVMLMHSLAILAGGVCIVLLNAAVRQALQHRKPCIHCLHWLHSIHNTNLAHDSTELVTYQMCCRCGTVFGTVNGAMAPQRRLEHGPHLLYARTRE